MTLSRIVCLIDLCVDDATVEHLELKLGLKAEKKFGELKSDRERKEDLDRFIDAMERYQDSQNQQAEQDAAPNH